MPVAFGDRVVGVQAFGVDHSQVEATDAGRSTQGQIESSRGVFAEHQILPIGQREGLFVGAFHGGLHGGAERRFGVIDDHTQGKLVDKLVEVHMQMRGASLAVRGGDNALT